MPMRPWPLTRYVVIRKHFSCRVATLCFFFPPCFLVQILIHERFNHCVLFASSNAQQSTTAHYRRGRALLALGRVDEAIAALQRVTELEHAHTDAAVLIGRARQHQKQQQQQASA
jgi:hypothetical protein